MCGAPSLEWEPGEMEPEGGISLGGGLGGMVGAIADSSVTVVLETEMLDGVAGESGTVDGEANPFSS